MRPTNLELHGIDAPLDEELHLKAGDVSCVFEPARGYLRQIRLGNGHEIVGLIYLHVRSADWSTIMPEVKIVKQEVSKDGFHLEWDCHSVAQDVDVVWHGTATGSANGTIVYRCEGHAVHKTITNRTGVCALIPATYAGHADVVLTHPDHTKTTVKLPEHVSPVEPLHNYVGASYPGASLAIEGDVYNAEDQRNWSDNSFKAYPICGTRSLYTLQEGAKFLNQITITPHPETLSAIYQPAGDRPLTTRFPELGVRVTGSEGELTAADGCVGFVHLEVPHDQIDAAIQTAQAAATKLGVNLALELHGQTATDAITKLANDGTTRIIGLDVHGGPLGQKDRDALGQATVTGATSFTDLNFHGALEGIPAGIYFGVMPQIHTFDETSILDNTRTLEESSRSARALSKSGISHATLALSPQTDPRLNSQFGAVWLLMSCLSLAKGNTATVVVSPFAEAFAGGKPAHITHLLKKLHALTGAIVDYAKSTNFQNLVVLSTDKGIFVANRTRQERPMSEAGQTFGSKAEVLTANGWEPKDLSQPLGPYEIVSFS